MMGEGAVHVIVAGTGLAVRDFEDGEDELQAQRTRVSSVAGRTWKRCLRVTISLEMKMVRLSIRWERQLRSSWSWLDDSDAAADRLFRRMPRPPQSRAI